MTEPYNIKTGVRQRCLLSPLLFLVALDWVAWQAFAVNDTGIQLTLLQKLEDLNFAVDLVLLSQKITHMRQKLEALYEQAAWWARRECIQDRGDEALGKTTTCTYLGSLITTTVGTEEDVEASFEKVQAALWILRPVWRSKSISPLWTKLRIFISYVKSVLLHEAETWRLTKKIIAKLHAVINRRLRYILGVWWREGFRMRTCGNVPIKGGLKSSGEGKGGGLAKH